MLLVKHYVAPSPIHGLGLFLNEAVKKGHVVWKFEPTFDTEIPENLLHYLLDPFADAVRENAEYISARGVFRLGNDGDIFMNHSDQPTLVDFDEEMRAVRDLSCGEELTCDYRSVHVLSFEPSEVSATKVART